MKIKSSNYEYSVFLLHAEEGGYIVNVPALPGCMTQGETVEEAIAMAKEAIDLYLETLVERGKEIPVEDEHLITRIKGKIPRVGKATVTYAMDNLIVNCKLNILNHMIIFF